MLSKNLRYHVPGGGIDKAIEDTIRDYPEDFWFKNNGITIICSSFRLDGKEVKLKDFSIINGGQTTYMIHKSKNVSEELNFYLPCKIIKTIGDTEDDKSNFILEIAKATNSQKAIKKVDLKANSPEQVRFAQAMRQAGVFYQTKRGESVPKEYKETYKNSDLSEVGKLCLSAIFQMPGASRNKPSTLYEPPYYEFIFDGDQKKISNIVKELLYIDNYWKKKFKAQYEKETIIEEKTEAEKDKELMLTILQTKKSIQEASINYEYADGKLIDYFLYTVKAEQAKLDYLIEKAKSKGLTLEITENANLKKG